jgi:hypothetical protein
VGANISQWQPRVKKPPPTQKYLTEETAMFGNILFRRMSVCWLVTCSCFCDVQSFSIRQSLAGHSASACPTVLPQRRSLILAASGKVPGEDGNDALSVHEASGVPPYHGKASAREVFANKVFYFGEQAYVDLSKEVRERVFQQYKIEAVNDVYKTWNTAAKLRDFAYLIHAVDREICAYFESDPRLLEAKVVTLQAPDGAKLVVTPTKIHGDARTSSACETYPWTGWKKQMKGTIDESKLTEEEQRIWAYMKRQLVCTLQITFFLKV